MPRRLTTARLTFLLDGVEHVLLISDCSEVLDHAGLTSAERTVAEGALSGLTTRGIARQRGVSERTVANQLAAIFRKLGVSSRAQLASALSGPRGRAVKPSRARGR